MGEVTVVATKILFERTGVRILIDTIEEDGKQRPYFYLEGSGGAAATVGVTAQNELLLTRQYRHPIRQVIYDLPAGRLNPGEAPIDGARREFEEETGYYPEHIIELGHFNQFPGTLNVTTHLFFANDLTPTHQHLDEGEKLEVARKPVSEVLEMIRQNECIDGSLQLGVLLALHKGLIHP